VKWSDPLALHDYKIIPYLQKYVFVVKRKTSVVEVVDLVLFPKQTSLLQSSFYLE
jgi:hypothetical protein